MKEGTTITFPEQGKGTYILILRLAAPAIIPIGKLGTFQFPAGWYAYVGSAFGAGGLRGRLKHHLSPADKSHWHIDYLRRTASLEAVWYAAGETTCEHLWAERLRSMPNVSVPVPHFGASDCDCPTHLFHFECCPDFAEFIPFRWFNDPSRNQCC